MDLLGRLGRQFWAALDGALKLTTTIDEQSHATAIAWVPLSMLPGCHLPKKGTSMYSA